MAWEDECTGYTRNRAGDCDDDDRDDGPLLPYRHRQHAPRPESPRPDERRRRLSPWAVVKIGAAVASVFCFLTYIPMYSRVETVTKEPALSGWTMDTNRDTKVYIRPYDDTTLYAPENLCSKKLYLLIVVCSATENFELRDVIRETWGNYTEYLSRTILYRQIHEKYKNFNYSYDIYLGDTLISPLTQHQTEPPVKMSYKDLLPKLVETLSRTNAKDFKPTVKSTTVENRFEELPEEVLSSGDTQENNDELPEDYDYESNIMRIEQKTNVDDVDLDKIAAAVSKVKEKPRRRKRELDFKLVFLLGRPADTNSTVQARIDEEYMKYGDLIQEDFIDSYYNLTLKSIMMLKWVKQNCYDNLRYVLKADDDVYINVPNLMATLRERSAEHDRGSAGGGGGGSAGGGGGGGGEYLMLGAVHAGAKPILDAGHKWYSPKYMYAGKTYPRYLSGVAYALSTPAAAAVYRAALTTPYFHLEDVFITGLCAARARPRVRARDAAAFYPYARLGDAACDAWARALVHRLRAAAVRALHRALGQRRRADLCARMYLKWKFTHQHKNGKTKSHRQTRRPRFTRAGLALRSFGYYY